MKITIVVIQFPPRHIGGTELQAQKMAWQLAERDNLVHVVTQHDKGLPYEEKVSKNLFIHRCRKTPIPKVGNFISMIFNTLRIALETGAEIILAYTLHPSGLAAVMAGKILRKPTVVWGRGNDIYLKSRLPVKLVRLAVVMSADIVLTQTNDMKNRFLKMWGHIQKLKVVPNAIDLKRFQQKREAAPSTPTVTYVGGLRPEKGVQYLIEALKLILEEIAETRLIIVGKGSEEKRLAALANSLGVNENISWVGEVPHNKVADYMNQSRILALPSISEGFPNVLLEAMACGVPIVATEVGGVPDVVKDGINGLLVKSRDPNALAKAIIRLLKDDQLRKRITERNKKEVQKYTLNAIIPQIEHILRIEVRKYT